ncbi:hypothetical protein LXA43DRAFT_598561 [Ganoderma leucocontextum]|nr:hypothetical protein LXA43DRAFT_598561 [Ganoderma leucocontextum]
MSDPSSDDEMYGGYTPSSPAPSRPRTPTDLSSHTHLAMQTPSSTRTELQPRTSSLYGTEGEGVFIDPQLQAISTLGPSASALKRRQDLTQYFEAQATQKRLKGHTKEEFRLFLKKSPDEREAIQAAWSCEILQHFREAADQRVEAASSWEVPPDVQKAINKYAIRLLLSPIIGEYDGNPILVHLLNLITTKQIGLPADLKTKDEAKWEKVVTWARHCLTQRKSEIKKAIFSSCDVDEVIPKDGVANTGVHIYTLSKHLIASVGSRSGGADTNATITVDMCARIAFLRSTARKFTRKKGFMKTYDSSVTKTVKYWAFVDNELGDLRSNRGQNNAVKVHKLLLQILKGDQQRFPAQANQAHNDVTETLKNATPTDNQATVDTFLTNANPVGTALAALAGTTVNGDGPDDGDASEQE